jgi:predicted Mrr-cat superfamily restriction endonuclease
MKKILFLLVLMVLSISLSAVFASESNTATVLKSDNSVIFEDNMEKVSEGEIHPLEMRIYEIRNMDKSDLTAEEKQELRKELKDIRREANQPGRGVYISISGLIIVILLILLLR